SPPHEFGNDGKSDESGLSATAPTTSKACALAKPSTGPRSMDISGAGIDSFRPLSCCIAVLQFAGQSFAVSNHALAVLFFTPMALLIAMAGSVCSDVSQLLVARSLDTIIGCGVGLAVLLATYRTDAATVRNALSETLAAAKPLLPSRPPLI